MFFYLTRNKPHTLDIVFGLRYFFSPDAVKVTIMVILLLSLGDKDDDDDDDADDKMQSSVLTGGEEGRQGSQEQSEVDHGDFEMVVSMFFCDCLHLNAG